MIDSIGIEGFQSLESVELSLSSFTVVVGESDVGKSAVIRAVRAAVENQTGRGFIRNGAENAQVTISAEDDGIGWFKGSSASYELWHLASGNMADYYPKARGVPDEIADLFRLAPIKIGDVETDPNFHGQFDKPYLIAETGTVRAKVLGELSGVNLIYLATQEAKRRQGRVSASLTAKQAEVESLEKKLKSYEWLPGRKTMLATAQRVLDVATGHCERRAALGKHLDEVVQLEFDADYERAVRIPRCESVLAAFDAVDLTQIDRADACGAMAFELRTAERVLANRQAALERAERALQDVRDELAGIQTCPTCGGLIAWD